MKTIFLLCACLCLSANAVATTIKYSGVVTSASTSILSGSIYDQIEIGDTIEGQFNYDPNGVIDSLPDNDMVGIYNFNESNSGFQFSVFDSSNDNTVIYHESGRLAHITVENDWVYSPNPSAYPKIDAFTPVGLLNDGAFVYLRYQNRDNNLDLIANDELPLLPLAYENYNIHEGSLSLPTGYLGTVDFNLTSLTPVPVPPAHVLFISAFVLLFATVGLRKSNLY